MGLDLFYDASWEERLAASTPEVLVADGATGKARPLVWERMEPGHFHASTPLVPGQWMRGAVQVGASALPFGPVAAGTDPEWMFDRQRVAELQDVAGRSGGGERINLSKIWQAPRQPEFFDLRPWLLVALLLAFVAEALGTRLGWQLPGLGRVRWPQWVARVRRARPPAVVSPVVAAAPEPPTPVSPVDEQDAVRTLRAARFRKAKTTPGSRLDPRG